MQAERLFWLRFMTTCMRSIAQQTRLTSIPGRRMCSPSWQSHACICPIMQWKPVPNSFSSGVQPSCTSHRWHATRLHPACSTPEVSLQKESCDALSCPHLLLHSMEEGASAESYSHAGVIGLAISSIVLSQEAVCPLCVTNGPYLLFCFHFKPAQTLNSLHATHFLVLVHTAQSYPCFLRSKTHWFHSVVPEKHAEGISDLSGLLWYLNGGSIASQITERVFSEVEATTK